MSPGQRLTILCVAALLSACAGPPSRLDMPGVAAAASKSDGEQRWQTFCFRLPFDAAGRPVWATDLVLADRVVAPALRAHATEIPLWRFHRRAAPDAAGHQFSVLVYTTQAVYDEIRRQVDGAPTLNVLKSSGRLDSVSFDCRPAQRLADPGATSDPSWNTAVQRAWPYFIMGVSASWLALVQDLASAIPGDAADLPAAYAAVDSRIAELWGRAGQHAFLHHLNGIYGYKPVRIETWINF